MVAAGARSGNLSIMASGPEQAFQHAGDVLSCFRKSPRLGVEHGIGSTVKTVNQLLAAVFILQSQRGNGVWGESRGRSRNLYEVISGSAGSSWMWNNRVPHILNNDYTPLSAVDIFVKDLAIVLGTAHRLNFPFLLTAAECINSLLLTASGLGREDDSAVFKVFQKLSGISINQEKRRNSRIS